jgi:hypothetical protein
MMNKDPVTFKVAGIKCDTEGCNFKDDTVKQEDYKQWLNKPCPLCGANLLTQADYNIVAALNTFASLCNAPVIKQVLKAIGGKKKNFKVNLNGTGNVKFTEE